MTDQVITISASQAVPHGFKLVDVSQKGNERWRLLSPAVNSNVWCYGNLSSYCMQNAWMFSQVYADMDNNGVPKPEWYDFRDKGFRRKAAVFKLKIAGGKEPLYTYWNNVKYKKIEARKYIYVPLYLRSIKGSQQMKQLKKMYLDGIKLAIRDTNTYPDKPYEEILNDPHAVFGHGMVIKNELEKMKNDEI